MMPIVMSALVGAGLMLLIFLLFRAADRAKRDAGFSWGTLVFLLLVGAILGALIGVVQSFQEFYHDLHEQTSPKKG